MSRRLRPRHVHPAAWICAGVFALASSQACLSAQPGSLSGTSVVALDHMPLVVGDLDAAARTYAGLGFALKPGRSHANGLRNLHLKFPDGSGIELLAPERGPTDALAARYHAERAAGDGPVFFALHASDDARLERVLRESGFAFHREDGALTLDEPALSFLFFGGDNRSPTDRPEHFAHANSAIAMSGVWIALDPDASRRMSTLLLALGAERGRAVLPLGDGVQADVFTVSNGRIALLPQERRVRPHRPIVGVEFRVRDPARVPRCGGAADAADAADPSGPSGPSGPAHACLFAPSETHGLWMRFSN